MIFDRPKPNMIVLGFPAFLVITDTRRGLSISFFVGAYALFIAINWGNAKEMWNRGKLR
jgi:hypothetical protein